MSKVEQIILHSVQQYNILPLTSRCNVKCVFCSHKQNPPGVEVIEIPPRTMEEIHRAMAFLNPEKKVVIGESATRIIEGEPFTHPNWKEVLGEIRKQFPSTPIAITTNGRLLSQDTVEFLSQMQSLELNVSLNSASEKGRLTLMRDNKAETSIAGLKLLKLWGIKFHGSIVAMPHLIGWDDLYETSVFLDQCGAQTIRVFMPGFSKFAPEFLTFNHKDLHQRLADFITSLSDQISSPVLLEPPINQNLLAVVEGVIPGSLAQGLGIQKNDVIRSVNGAIPRCRVEAWELMHRLGPVKVLVERESRNLTFTWENGLNTKSGIVMNYDFDPERMEELASLAIKYRGENVLILASDLAVDIVRQVIQSIPNCDFYVYPVKNRFFGGSIGAAGLLTVDDFFRSYAAFIKDNPKPTLVLVPKEAFDYWGKDLTGQAHWELEALMGVKVIIL